MIQSDWSLYWQPSTIGLYTNWMSRMNFCMETCRKMYIWHYHQTSNPQNPTKYANWSNHYMSQASQKWHGKTHISPSWPAIQASHIRPLIIYQEIWWHLHYYLGICWWYNHYKKFYDWIWSHQVSRPSCYSDKKPWSSQIFSCSWSCTFNMSNHFMPKEILPRPNIWHKFT